MQQIFCSCSSDGGMGVETVFDVDYGKRPKAATNTTLPQPGTRSVSKFHTCKELCWLWRLTFGSWECLVRATQLNSLPNSEYFCIFCCRLQWGFYFHGLLLYITTGMWLTADQKSAFSKANCGKKRVWSFDRQKKHKKCTYRPHRVLNHIFIAFWGV